MAWLPLESDDVLNSLSDTEQGVYATEQSGNADLASICFQVTGLVRGRVNAAKRNQGHLGPQGTIPDELYGAAISIARYKLITHWPENQLMAADRQDDMVHAYGMLDQAARGELVVVRGDDPDGQTPVMGSASGASARSLQYDPRYPSGFWEESYDPGW